MSGVWLLPEVEVFGEMNILGLSPTLKGLITQPYTKLVNQWSKKIQCFLYFLPKHKQICFGKIFQKPRRYLELPIIMHSCELGIGRVFTFYMDQSERLKHYPLVWNMLTQDILRDENVQRWIYSLLTDTEKISIYQNSEWEVQRWRNLKS